MDMEGRRKTWKAWYHSSRALCQVDGGGCGPTANKFKKCRRSCVDHRPRLRVPTSHGAFQPSRLDDEQPSGPARLDQILVHAAVLLKDFTVCHFDLD